MEETIPASVLRQHCFCPRIPYYSLFLGIQAASPLWTEQGNAHHIRQTMLERRRNLVRYGLRDAVRRYNCHLRSEGMSIHGICDAILESGDCIYPLEFKIKGDQPTRGHKLQLVAYGLMAEEKFKLRFQMGFVLFGNRGKTSIVEATMELKDELRQCVKDISMMLRLGTLPDSPATDRK